MTDLLFQTDAFVFSYRVAGVLRRDNKILLQKPKNDDGYSIPGGHVVFNETSEDALIREYKEEIGADIKIDRLFMIGENFFPWGKKPCHQVFFYYLISLKDETQIPLDGTFEAYDEMGNKRIDLKFCWVPLSKLDGINLYPTNVKEDLLLPPKDIKHFVYRQ